MEKFKIGDRVEWVGNSETSYVKGVMNIGAAGTVKDVYEDYMGNVYAVEFDDAFSQNHTCDGACKNKHGWWCKENEIRILNQKPKSREFKLIITEGEYMTDAERCICCGDIIPEGRQVCIKCENEITDTLEDSSRDELSRDLMIFMMIWIGIMLDLDDNKSK